MALSTYARRHLAVAMANRGAADEVANILDAASVLSGSETAFIDGVTAGTPAASKALVLDSNLELDSVGVIKSASKLITTAQVKALNATPIELVAAPGAGKYLEFLRAYLFLDHAGTDYDGIAAGEDLAIKYTDASGDIASQVEATGFLDASADALALATPSTDIIPVANAALVLHMLTGEIATGDSPLKVLTVYREIRTAALEAIA